MYVTPSNVTLVLKDALKTDLKAFDIGYDSWKAAASNRAHWYWNSMIWNGAAVCVANKTTGCHQTVKTSNQEGPYPKPY